MVRVSIRAWFRIRARAMVKFMARFRVMFRIGAMVRHGLGPDLGLRLQC